VVDNIKRINLAVSNASRFFTCKDITITTASFFIAEDTTSTLEELYSTLEKLPKGFNNALVEIAQAEITAIQNESITL